MAPEFEAGSLSLSASPLALSFDGPLCVDGRPQTFEPISTVPHVGWDGAPLTPLPMLEEEPA
jgi:hypothetical protein